MDLPFTMICVSETCTRCTADGSASPRFVDNGDGTITDRQTCLVWEKKSADGSLHDKDLRYPWDGMCWSTQLYCQPSAAASDACFATGSPMGCNFGCPNEEACHVTGDLPTIWEWLVQVNDEGGVGFARHRDWRIPKIDARHYGDPTGAPAAAELETILTGTWPCSDCVPSEFNTECIPGCSVTTCSCTRLSPSYWSATTYGNWWPDAWYVDFSTGFVFHESKVSRPNFVRAVRGGT